MKQSIQVIIIICLIISSIVSCSSSKNWVGNDTPGNNTASFTGYSGKRSFPLLVDAAGPLSIKYIATINEGELLFIIRSSSGIIVNKKISSAITDSVTVNSSPGQQYRIIIKGKKASGSFAVSYGIPSAFP